MQNPATLLLAEQLSGAAGSTAVAPLSIRVGDHRAVSWRFVIIEQSSALASLSPVGLMAVVCIVAITVLGIVCCAAIWTSRSGK